MKKLLALLLALLPLVGLTACMQDSLDSLRISGDVTTGYSTGSGHSSGGTRMRTDISF